MVKVEYIDGNYDAIVFLNTSLLEIELLKNICNVPILAADGAGNTLLKNGVVPDFIIGDLDSFNSDSILNYGYPKEKLIKIEGQDSNDFEKTLKFSIANGYSNILIIGIHGGDYEHSLNNWSVFSKYSNQLNLTILENNRYGFCMNSSFEMKTDIDEIISLIPVSKSKLKTTNLEWNLDNEELELGIREGARNRSVNTFIKIDIIYGEIFVFCNSRFPNIKIIKNN
jgi:thiamine pyrophosphokinase